MLYDPGVMLKKLESGSVCELKTAGNVIVAGGGDNGLPSRIRILIVLANRSLQVLNFGRRERIRVVREIWLAVQ